MVCVTQLIDRLNKAGSDKDANDDADDQSDQQATPERAGEVSAIDVVAVERENNQQDKTDQWNREQNRVS